MAKSDKNLLKDIFRAQGIYVHGDVPDPTPEALKLFSTYGFESWKRGNSDGWHDAQNDYGQA